MKRTITRSELLGVLTAKQKRAQIVREKAYQRAIDEGRTPLTIEVARAIRTDYATGDYTQKQLAAKYGYNIAYIGRILRHTLFPER